MIGKLKGKIDLIKNGYAIVDVQGVGYRVFVSELTLGKIVRKENVELYIHTHVREDHIALYGFADQEELEMFEMLLSISGVGPKAGLGILTIASPAMIRKAIMSEDPSILTRVSGVGKKTAERIILELKSKIANIPGRKGEVEATGHQEVIDALMSMGYTAAEAREGLKAVPKNINDITEQIKLALQGMKK